MKFFLLTHEREICRKTNTGRLVLDTLGEDAVKIIWERKSPDEALLKAIEAGDIALLYPSSESQLISKTCKYDNYIILDGTWQEAKKIYNKSPYLQLLPKVSMQTDQKSKYTLRRNQKEDGLCTAEIASEVLANLDHTDLAQTLDTKLMCLLSERL
ncbi:MAG: DTW domain-containing protein [Thiovulaceae bacterium]|nr:DTW domain-containing protein [Sulfurimonadaceae bacterium]